MSQPQPFWASVERNLTFICRRWAMRISIISSLALFVSVNMHSLSGRWPNPYLAVRSWYVYWVLYIWWISLPCCDIHSSNRLVAILSSECFCVWITIYIHTCMHTYTYTHMYVYIYIYISAQCWSLVGVLACHCTPTHAKTQTGKRRGFISGNFKDDKICCMYYIKGNEGRYMSLYCTCLHLAFWNAWVQSSDKHVLSFYSLTTDTRTYSMPQGCWKAHYSSILFMLHSKHSNSQKYRTNTFPE